MRDVYRALSDPTRRKILHLLRKRDLSAGEIAEHFPIAKPTLSKHFTVLKEADLIQGRRNGTTIMYSLNISVLEDALCQMLDTFKINPKSKSPKE
jgi:ArsR family transcriptional regulator, arsenate/arsenite/antimonite-responsive transcriptional repressor